MTVHFDPGLAKARADQWSRRTCERVELTLPFPPSVNSIWRRAKTGMRRDDRYKSWFVAAGTELNAQRPGLVKGRFRFTMLLGRKDARKRDLDNTLKGPLDLLQHHGVIEDDSLAQSITVSWSEFVTGCRVIVEAA